MKTDIDTNIVYIHIYSRDKVVHPPALLWENTKTLIPTEYLVRNSQLLQSGM